MTIAEPYQKNEGDLVGQSLSKGQSMTETMEKMQYDKYEPFTVTDMSSQHQQLQKQEATQRLKEESDQETSRDELVWHTADKSTPISQMDLDFKLVACIHTLKCANRAHQRMIKAEDDLTYFMDMLETFEENLHKEHRIKLPDTVEQMRQLRTELKNRGVT